MSRIQALLYRVGLERGRYNENRLLRVLCEKTPDTPDWFIRAEPAGRELDKRGVDAIVYTSNGKFYLQSKSSKRFADKFFAERNHRNIGVIIVNPMTSDDQIRRKVYSVIEGLRRKFFEKSRD